MITGICGDDHVDLAHNEDASCLIARQWWFCTPRRSWSWESSSSSSSSGTRIGLSDTFCFFQFRVVGAVQWEITYIAADVVSNMLVCRLVCVPEGNVSLQNIKSLLDPFTIPFAPFHRRDRPYLGCGIRWKKMC